MGINKVIYLFISICIYIYSHKIFIEKNLKINYLIIFLLTLFPFINLHLLMMELEN